MKSEKDTALEMDLKVAVQPNPSTADENVSRSNIQVLLKDVF